MVWERTKDCASSASVAKKLGIPVVLIIDGKQHPPQQLLWSMDSEL